MLDSVCVYLVCNISYAILNIKFIKSTRHFQIWNFSDLNSIIGFQIYEPSTETKLERAVHILRTGLNTKYNFRSSFHTGTQLRLYYLFYYSQLPRFSQDRHLEHESVSKDKPLLYHDTNIMPMWTLVGQPMILSNFH